MKKQCLAFWFSAMVHVHLCASINFGDEDAAGSFAADQERLHKDILDQVGFALRAGVDPVTVVTQVEGIRPVPNDQDETSEHQVELPSMTGRGVIYLGEDVLPPGSTVGLYRALLVRKDVLYEWIDDGTMEKDVWQDFWKYYSVEFTLEEDTTGSSWMAIPVGDAGKGPDEATWWVQGPIAEKKFEEALISLNAKVLVDWRRLAAGKGGRYYLFNAHIINEPSGGGTVSMDGELLQDEKDEKENIGHLHGSGCSDGLTYCGAVFEAKTSRNVQPGEQLLWCYGKNYARDYPVAQVCLTDDDEEF